MLNELIDIFMGMYSYALELMGGTEYEDKLYFVSQISLFVSASMIIGTFLVVCTIIRETFRTIRGCSR